MAVKIKPDKVGPIAKTNEMKPTKKAVSVKGVEELAIK
jgi:hypothetical protein